MENASYEDLLKEAKGEGLRVLRTEIYKDVFKTVDTYETLTVIGAFILSGVTIGVVVSAD